MHGNNILSGKHFSKDFRIQKVARTYGETIGLDASGKAKLIQDRQIVLLPESKDTFAPYVLHPTSGNVVREAELTKEEKAHRPPPVKMSRLELFGGSLWWLTAFSEPQHMDLEILYNAMVFWGCETRFTEFLKLPPTSELSQIPYIPRLAKLPIDLQLDILERLRFKDIDLALNFAFSHFVPSYFRIQTMPKRFTQWYERICSRNNLRHVCTQDLPQDYYNLPNRWEVYRLKSPQYDCYPELSMRTFLTPFLVDLEPLVPGLDLAQVKILTAIERIFWKHKMGIGYGRNPWVKGSSSFNFSYNRDSTKSLVRIWSGYYEGPSHAEKRFLLLAGKNVRCLFIPLDYEQLKLWKPKNLDDHYHVYPMQYGLLLFQEELTLMMEDFGFFARPRLLELRDNFTPGMSQFPPGLDLLTEEEEAGWRYAGSQLLRIHVLELEEKIFLEACAEIRYTFDPLLYAEEIFWEACADIRFTFHPFPPAEKIFEGPEPVLDFRWIFP